MAPRRCPRCGGYLYREDDWARDRGSVYRWTEWACLMCSRHWDDSGRPVCPLGQLRPTIPRRRGRAA